MNRIELTGNIIKDAEIRYTKNNKPVTTFTIGSRRTLKNQNGEYDSDFIPITMYSDKLTEYLKKGTKILVEGTIQNKNWTDEENKKHYDYNFICNKIEFLSSNKSEPKEQPKQEIKEETKEKKENPLAYEIFEEFGKNIEISEDEIAF